MSATNTFETALLGLIFNNTNIANIGDATGLQGSTAAGSLFVSLHTADPGEAGTQSTSEATYTSYARVAVVRSSSGWTIAGNQFSNAASINFPAATGGTNTITHFGIGTASTGGGSLLLKGALSGGGLAVSSGITPVFNAGALTGTAD